MSILISTAIASGATMLIILAQGVASEVKSFYRIRTGGCTLEMQVETSKRYAGTPVFFYPEEKGSETLCLSETGDLGSKNCVKDFEGAVAIVRFSTSPGDEQRCSAMREHVRVIDQDAALHEYGPFDAKILLDAGIGSDIQLFGFGRREFLNRGVEARSWRLFRQELFMDSSAEPFVIVHWKHTLKSIDLIDVIPVGSTDLQEHSPNDRPKRDNGTQ